MRLKSLLIGAFVLIAASLAQGQDMDRLFFFDEGGAINYNKDISNDLGYTLVHLDNRADDVVWAHIVYKIIDLRDNQNSQLTFPIERDLHYKNLFRVISEAIATDVSVYYPNESDITPNFDKTNRIQRDKLSDAFYIETNVAGAQYIDPLFELDTVTDVVSINNRIYDRFSKRVNKFMIQQVFYFDKHLSMIRSKIIGIAPMIDVEDVNLPDFSFLEEDTTNDESMDLQDLKSTLRESVLGWILYEDLKPKFSTQLVFQKSNIAQRITYHEFFAKKMFSAYLIGDNNSIKQLYYNTSKLRPDQLMGSIETIERKLIELESNLFHR